MAILKFAVILVLSLFFAAATCLEQDYKDTGKNYGVVAMASWLLTAFISVWWEV